MGRVLGTEDMMKSLGSFCSSDREKPSPSQMPSVGAAVSQEPQRHLCLSLLDTDNFILGQERMILLPEYVVEI